jgi:outer membrane autotransporter protein
MNVNRKGAQVELGFRSGGFLSAGLTGGYEHARTGMDSGTGIDIEGWNYGAYAQFGSAAGLYGGVLAKRSNYHVRMRSPLFAPGNQPDAKSTGFDGEIGWRTPSMGAMLDLNAGVSRVRTTLDDFTAGFIDFESDRFTSTRGRIGARLGWAGDWAPFVGAKLFREFGDDNDILVGSGSLSDTITGRGHGTWGKIEAGLGGASGRPLLSGWVNVGDVKGFGVRAGFRF